MYPFIDIDFVELLVHSLVCFAKFMCIYDNSEIKKKKQSFSTLNSNDWSCVIMKTNLGFHHSFPLLFHFPSFYNTKYLDETNSWRIITCNVCAFINMEELYEHTNLELRIF